MKRPLVSFFWGGLRWAFSQNQTMPIGLETLNESNNKKRNHFKTWSFDILASFEIVVDSVNSPSGLALICGKGLISSPFLSCVVSLSLSLAVSYSLKPLWNRIKNHLKRLPATYSVMAAGLMMVLLLSIKLIWGIALGRAVKWWSAFNSTRMVCFFVCCSLWYFKTITINLLISVVSFSFMVAGWCSFAILNGRARPYSWRM